jgi:hypothetical protein
MLVCTPAHLVELTTYKQTKKQIEALGRMGIPFRVAPTGRPIVMLEDLPLSTKGVGRSPNYEALSTHRKGT